MLFLIIFLGKGFDDALAEDRFLEDGVEGGVGHLGLVGDAAHALTQAHDKKRRQRKDENGQQGQTPFPIKDHRRKSHDGKGIPEKAGHHLGDRILEKIDVVGEAAHEHAGGLAVKKGQGLALQRRKELVAHPADRGIADIAHLIVVRVRQNPFDKVDEHHQRR